jgi:hypothetical protein
MNSSVPLIHPIVVDVAFDGRLLRADGPALRLHLMAGGDEGGILAVPGLAALASATHTLKGRLSRAVNVADDSEDIELWVETELIDNVARLTISGWRTAAKPAEKAERGIALDNIDGMIELLFNQSLLLVSVSGDGGNDCFRIGDPPASVFAGDASGNILLLEAMNQHLPIQTRDISVGFGDNKYAVSAAAKYDRQQNFIGYVCQLHPLLSEPALELKNGSDPEHLFGVQLGAALRQPLGRIIANAETIGSKLQGPIRDSYAVYAKDIADAARHLVTLVDDLGDLEAIERSGFSTAKDVIELGDIARRVAGLLALKAADHSITILAPAETPYVAATAEFRRVLQIMINLVTNAIRYSPNGTQVRISIAQSGNFSSISVCDQGGGIRAEDREKIFNKFERLGRSGDGGSGLGLYISRRLARAMGGDLRADANEHGGAKFTLTVPR